LVSKLLIKVGFEKRIWYKSASATDILACGQAAAALDGVFCIGYQGESYKLYDQILA